MSLISPLFIISFVHFRKCSASNRILSARDHASIQVRLLNCFHCWLNFFWKIAPVDHSLLFSRSTSPLWTSPPAAWPEASPPTPSAAPSAGEASSNQELQQPSLHLSDVFLSAHTKAIFPLYLIYSVVGWVRATTASTGLPRRMASLTRSSKSVLSPDLLIIEIHEFNDTRITWLFRNKGFLRC